MKDEKFKIMIDQKPFEVENQLISGIEIKTLANVPLNYGVWLKVNGPDPDIEILDEMKIDLGESGREHFFTGSKTTTEG